VRTSSDIVTVIVFFHSVPPVHEPRLAAPALRPPSSPESVCYIPNMAASVGVHSRAIVTSDTTAPRHTALVRATHWITTVCFFLLLLTGIEILISHPRFYWGEAGNATTPPLFKIPIPASRATVPTGYGYVLPDQNGWSRYLHFQTAWAAVLTGLVYAIFGLFTGHFRKHLLPSGADLSWRAFSSSIADHLRFKPPAEAENWSYNLLQRLAYLVVIFVLFPLVIWTGLAMSPAVVSAFPFTVTAFGGQQSARTIHFFVSLFLAAFVLVHIVMISLAGFRNRMRAMITGRASTNREQA
jgi:thiosulfate reductase cytochrome b subunit